jgi:transcription-repair coupling factor (superfamily II helicase)
MRDLEIRGAGNLLGAEQSGHITAVGFELYCQLLKQSVSSLKGEKVKPRVEVQIRLDFLPVGESAPPPIEKRRQTGMAPASGTDPAIQKPRGGGISIEPAPSEFSSSVGAAYTDASAPGISRAEKPVVPASASIPFSYISDARQRIEVYRKLAQAGDKASIQALEKELRDRFGKIPPAVALLLQLAEIRILASEKAVTVIEVKEDRLMLTRNSDFVMIGSKFPRLTKATPGGRLTEIKKLLLAL